MRIRKKNVARLASISALGAGVLGIASGSAEAATIQYTALNGEVGFSPATKPVGSLSTFKVPIVPGISAYFKRSSFFNGSGALAEGLVNLEARISPTVSSARGGILFQTANANLGQKWINATSATAAFDLQLGGRTSSGGHAGQNGTFYKLFAFTTSSSHYLDWGWLELDQSVSSTTGPDVKILGMAFDTSGALIAAGDKGVIEGESSTPEPSTAALSSLSALALGAAGLRRWRSVRKQVA